MHHPGSRPAHILFIVENNTVPTDVRVWKEAKTARKNGYEVSIIAPKSKVFCKKYEVIDGIHIYRHPAFNNGHGKINQLLEYATACLWESILSWRVFLEKRFDIIHAANPPDHVFLIAKVFRPFSVRFVFDHHDLAPELFLGKFGSRKNLFYRLLILMERYSCRSADAVISTNESYKRIVLRRHGLRPESVFIVRNDPEVEAEPTRPLPREASIGGPTKLLYVGSINNQDGVDLLIKSLHLLVRQLRQTKIHCTVIGDGDHLKSVRRLCDELGIGSFLTFTGYIHDRRIVKEYIAEADICLETAPDNEANRKSTFIKVMEYMLAGKPVVAFDLDETRFTLQDSGLLVSPNRLDHFANAIQKLIEDPPERRRLGEMARSRILDGLNWSNAASEMIRAYNYTESRLPRNPVLLKNSPVDGL
jgi:glycosyltransferase involved in cell wall biosynthesis